MQFLCLCASRSSEVRFARWEEIDLGQAIWTISDHPMKTGKALSDVALSKGVTIQGLRSTFRDWCGEATSWPRDVAGMALAHTIANKVEAAYRRGDLFAKRRDMMQQ